ncbi:hypothetical protein KZX46_03125 (plasmid) [Polymorphobacter sp. PAMC 29334]|nr:hypothetical protein KZX46_03125 [Polymorphobacter sp. PAMC 29334]
MTVMILPPEPSRKSVNLVNAGANVVSAPACAAAAATAHTAAPTVISINRPPPRGANELKFILAFLFSSQPHRLHEKIAYNGRITQEDCSYLTDISVIYIKSAVIPRFVFFTIANCVDD